LGMRDGPSADRGLADSLSVKYFGTAIPEEMTKDPLTDEVLDYGQLVDDVVTRPKHGYSRFHIGHQDPRSQPKHRPKTVRWQLKASNDFQGTMDIRVARIALRIDTLTRNPQADTAREVSEAFARLCEELGLRTDSARRGGS